MSEEASGRSFDELAKGLASGNVSRRKALRLMGAALLGGTLASIPGMAWAARTPPTGKGGCPQGKTLCRGKCYDLQRDQNNCGQCGNVCAEDQVCQGGTCLVIQGGLCSTDSQCASGLVCRNGTCVPTPVCSPTDSEACTQHLVGSTCCPGDDITVFSKCCKPGDVCVNPGLSTRECVTPA